MSLTLNTELNERYRIVRNLKTGGFGAVYEARDTKLADTPCAIKEILDSVREGENGEYAVSRFYHEMKSLAELEHPGIPRVRDYFKIDSRIYIVMDLIPGRNLEDEMLASNGGLDPASVVRDVIQLLEVLDYMHRQRPVLLHRDIKPGNIVRDERTGKIKLVDFGLVKEFRFSALQTAVGTLGYCAPEQLGGMAEVRSDIYSVGVTLHQLLTGTRPRLMNLGPMKLNLPGVRPGLHEIIRKATQMDVDQRYTSAQEMSRDLIAWLSGDTPSAVHARRYLATHLRLKRRRRSRKLLGAALTALAVAGLATAGHFASRVKVQFLPPPVQAALSISNRQ